MKAKTPFAMALSICTLVALTSIAPAQNVDVRHDSKDSKSVPITQEKEPDVQFLLETGWESEYNFRGTNLMPGAIGAYFYQIQATIPHVGPGALTLGVYGIHQIGDAQANTWSISEGGGGGGNQGSSTGVVGGGSATFTRFPTTFQKMFREWDLFVSYKMSLGPVDLTIGNIAFLIQRDAQTFETDVLQPGFIWVVPPTGTPFRYVGPEPTVQDEQFDRLYVRLSTSKIRHIVPSITYYQTIYSEGDQPTDPSTFFFRPDSNGNMPSVNPGPNHERNEEHGGYLEGRVNGNFPVGSWLDINPYAIVSYSFDDRSEPAMGFAGTPLTGWNHAQAGLELDFHVSPNVAIVPFAAYSYHISEPPIGTDRNEYWGGIKVSVNLP